MKRFSCFFLVFLTLLLVFCCTVSAAVPVYELYGDPDQSGVYSLSYGYVKGDFEILNAYQTLVDVFLREIPLNSYFSYYAQDNTRYYWRATFYFDDGLTSYGDGITDVAHYSGIEVILWNYALDEARGNIYSVYLINRNGGSGSSVVFLRDFDQLSNSYINLTNTHLNFGTSADRNYVLGTDSNSELFNIYYLLFGQPVINGEQAYRGLWVPVLYVEFYDPIGTLPDYDVGDVGRVGVILLDFLNTVLHGFVAVLEIEFFGGFFTLGHVMGLVVGIGMIKLFLRYFAGG